jgi:hypothetical protein
MPADLRGRHFGSYTALRARTWTYLVYRPDQNPPRLVRWLDLANDSSKSIRLLESAIPDTFVTSPGEAVGTTVQARIGSLTNTDSTPDTVTPFKRRRGRLHPQPVVRSPLVRRTKEIGNRLPATDR